MPVLVVIMLRIMSVGMGIMVVTGIAPMLGCSVPVLAVIMLGIMSVGMVVIVVSGIAPVLGLWRFGTGAKAVFRRAG